MKSHSFTTEDAAKQEDNVLKKLTDFAPEYDPSCKLPNEVIQMNTGKVQENFNKDINRTPNFCIETTEGIVDLAATYKKEKGSDYKVTYKDMYDTLTNDKYKLSQNQAEYILATAYQGGIAGGLAGFGEVIVSNVTNPMNWMNRDGNMSKIVIDKDSNVSYVGGQKMTFDCNRQTYDGIIHNTVHTEFRSEDYLAATITAKIGKIGVAEFKPQVAIDVAGVGEVGLKIVEQLQNIKSELPSKTPQAIVENYHNFSNSILQNNGHDKLYKQEVIGEVKKILSSKPAEIDHEKVENLKKLEFTKEALAETVMNQIDTRISEFKKDGSKAKITSKDIDLVANEAANSLQKFVGKSQGYLERFTKDLVQQRAESNEVEVPKKNFIQKIVSCLKDLWHGYSKESPEKNKDTLLEQVKLQAKEISKGVNVLPENKSTIPSAQSKTSNVSKGGSRDI